LGFEIISWREAKALYERNQLPGDVEIRSNRGHDVTACLVTWKDKHDYSYPMFGSKVADLLSAEPDADVYLLYHSGPKGGIGHGMAKVKGLKFAIWKVD